MAERLLEDGLSALESRLQLQIAGAGGSSVHSRKGFALDGEAGGEAAAAAAGAPAAGPVGGLPEHLTLPIAPMGDGTAGFHR
jgi:hypothetical protein